MSINMCKNMSNRGILYFDYYIYDDEKGEEKRLLSIEVSKNVNSFRKVLDIYYKDKLLFKKLIVEIIRFLFYFYLNKFNVKIIKNVELNCLITYNDNIVKTRIIVTRFNTSSYSIAILEM